MKCLYSDAMALSREIGGDTVVLVDGDINQIDFGEPQAWLINWRGSQLNAAQLLGRKGVTFGVWSLKGAVPEWVVLSQ